MQPEARRTLISHLLTLMVIKHFKQLSVTDEHALLVFSGCHKQYHRQCGLKNKDAYSHSSEGWRLRSRLQHSQVLVGASSWNADGPSTVHTLMVQGRGKRSMLSLVSLVKRTLIALESLPLWPYLTPVTSPNKAPGPKHHMGVGWRFWMCCGRHKHPAHPSQHCFHTGLFICLCVCGPINNLISH